MLQFVGLLLPPFIDLLNAKVSNDSVRFLVALVFCGVVGAVVYFVGRPVFNVNDLFQTIMTVFGLSQVTYQPVYGGSALQTKVKSLVS